MRFHNCDQYLALNFLENPISQKKLKYIKETFKKTGEKMNGNSNNKISIITDNIYTYYLTPCARFDNGKDT